jgi:phage antirepressor YoqD-like protein
MSTDLDLTTAAARAERDRLADRTDVLRKVRAFCQLPADTHITTELVARFYGVGIEAVRSLVKDNRAELESNGYKVYSRAEFERSSGDLSSLDPRARQIATFPIRAVLNVGMLLRDSEVAQEVRTRLLDAQQEQSAGIRMPDLSTPEGVAYMAAMFHDTANKYVIACNRLKEVEPKAAKFDNFLSAEGDYDVNEAAKVIQRADIEVGETRLWETLRMMRWTYKDHKGRPRAYQTAIEKGWLREKPMGEWQDDDGRVHLRTPQVRVRPGGIDKLIEMLRGAA